MLPFFFSVSLVMLVTLRKVVVLFPSTEKLGEIAVLEIVVASSEPVSFTISKRGDGRHDCISQKPQSQEPSLPPPLPRAAALGTSIS